MTSPHADPARHGTEFGDVVVTVDRELGDCVVRTTRPGPTGPIPISKRFHGIEEIEGAYRTQIFSAKSGETDVARALKFAGQALNPKRERKGRKNA